MTVRARLAAAPRWGATEAGLVLLAAPLWVLSAWWMGSMEMESRFDAGALAPFLVMWVMMMAAMMLPSVAPAVGVHRRVMSRHAARGDHVDGRTAVFIAGYLLAWTAVGLVAFMSLRLLAAGLADRSATELARWLIAPAALAAAAYQGTSLKRVCLHRCRGPFDFLLSRWRDGHGGALRMGFEHGAYCVGCCIALMGLLLAFGAASVTWMAIVAAAIAGEKLLPPPLVARGLTLAVALVGLAVVALVEPSALPGLGGMEGMDEVDDSMTMGPSPGPGR